MQAADTDGALLGRYLEHRDELAFAAVVERHMAMVMGVCRRIVPGAEAEDAAQAAFIVLATKAEQLSASPDIAGWLHRTSTHLALRLRASRAVRCRREAIAGHSAMEVPVDQVQHSDEDQRALKQRIDAAIEQLPARYRVPLVLHYLQGIPLEQLPERLGLTPAALAMRMMRGRRRLQRILSGFGLTAARLDIAIVIATSAAPTAGQMSRIAEAVGSFRKDPSGAGAAGDLARQHLHSAAPAWVALGAVAAALVLMAAVVGVQAAQARTAASQRTAATAPAPTRHLRPGSPAGSLSALPGATSQGGPGSPGGIAAAAAAAAGPEPEFLQINESDESVRNDARAYTIQVIEYADHAGHHLASWPDAQASVLDTVMTLASDHASVATIADKLSKMRSLPIHSATDAIGEVIVPTVDSVQKPMRAVLDQVCAASGLDWSIRENAVVIERPPPRPMARN